MPAVDWSAVVKAHPMGASNLLTVFGPRADKLFLSYYLARSTAIFGGDHNLRLPKIEPAPGFKNCYHVTLDKMFSANMLVDDTDEWKDGRLKITGEDGIFFTVQPVLSFKQQRPRREAAKAAPAPRK